MKLRRDRRGIREVSEIAGAGGFIELELISIPATAVITVSRSARRDG